MPTVGSNALGAKTVTLFGIVTLVNWLFANAPGPIAVTLFGIVTLVNWLV